MQSDTAHNEGQKKQEWQLIAILAVDKEDRVQCQCNGCGQGLYAQIHMILWQDQRIECWGSGCYKRELGYASGARQKPLYPSVGGRRLTVQERELLRNNREQLITGFKVERECELAAERQHDEQVRDAAEQSRRRDWQIVDGVFSRTAQAASVGAPKFPSPPAPTQDEQRQLLELARETVMARWCREGADPRCPGLSRTLGVEVQWEYERLLVRK